MLTKYTLINICSINEIEESSIVRGTISGNIQTDMQADVWWFSELVFRFTSQSLQIMLSLNKLAAEPKNTPPE